MTIERGFCTNKEHLPAMRAYGLPDKLTWVAGRGAESWEQCLASFRGRPGTLLVAPDLRVFGASKKAVAAAMAQMERARIRVVDIIHPQDETVAEMLHRAGALISGGRFPDRRTARRRGRTGGLARGAAAEQSRSVTAPDWLVRNIATDPALSWATRVRLLDGKFSESTLRRHYSGAP